MATVSPTSSPTSSPPSSPPPPPSERQLQRMRVAALRFEQQVMPALNQVDSSLTQLQAQRPPDVSQMQAYFTEQDRKKAIVNSPEAEAADKSYSSMLFLSMLITCYPTIKLCTVIKMAAVVALLTHGIGIVLGIGFAVFLLATMRYMYKHPDPSYFTIFMFFCYVFLSPLVLLYMGCSACCCRPSQNNGNTP